MQPCLSIESSFRADPTGDRTALGGELARDLLAKTNRQTSPTVLLVLFATHEFQEYGELLAGVRSVCFGEDADTSVPLVGCSVTAILVDGELQEQGVLLLAFCSDAVRVRTASAATITDDPRDSIFKVLQKLSLDHAAEFNPEGNRLVLMFQPGFRTDSHGKAVYNDSEIHQHFCEATNFELPICGGSASVALSDRSAAWHFHNDDVYQNGLVTALLDCDTRTGASMRAGLQETGDFLRVKDFDDDVNTVRSFYEEGDPVSHLRNRNNFAVFGAMNMTGDPTVLWPTHNKDGSVSFLRKLGNYRHLQVLEFGANPASNGSPSQQARTRAGVSAADVAATFAFVCTARLKSFEQDREFIGIGNGTAESANKAPFFGVYLNGECGLNSRGRPDQNNVQVSCVVFARNLSNSAQLRRHSRRLAETSEALLSSFTVKETVKQALAGIERAGFSGGMLSLICSEDDDVDTMGGSIVAQDAFGGGWKKIIELTRRPIGGTDVLAKVYESKSARYVSNSLDPDSHCDRETALLAGVISQYVAPLIGGKGQIIGIFQVDLGDLRDQGRLRDSLKHFLDSYVNQVGAALSRAMYHERVQIDQALDKAVVAAIACDTIEDACDEFLSITARAFSVDMAHVRLLSETGNHLDMIGGVGPYSQAARNGNRKRISRHKDIGPSALCFREYVPKKVMIVNDAENDVRAQPLRDANADWLPIGAGLRQQKAFANAPVFDEQSQQKMGVLSFATETPWAFTQHKVESLRAAGRRLAFLLTTLTAKHRVAEEMKFLSAAIPRISVHDDVGAALDQLAKGLGATCHADKVSVFRWDEERKLLVLAAEKGWCEPMVGKAVYSSGHAMTGSVLKHNKVLVVQDREKFVREHSSAPRYAKEMFGTVVETQTFEVIAFRLFVGNKLLGAIALYNSIPKSEVGDTRFAMTDQSILQKLQAGLSFYVYSLISMDNDRQTTRDEKHLGALSQDLLEPGKTQHVLENALENLANARNVEAIGVLLKEGDEPRELKMFASYGHPESLTNAKFRADDSPVLKPLESDSPVAMLKSASGNKIPLKFLRDFELSLASHDVTSYLATPMASAGGSAFGVISIINFVDPKTNRIPRCETEFYRRVGSRVGAFVRTRLVLQYEEEQEKTNRLLADFGLAAAGAVHPLQRPLRRIAAKGMLLQKDLAGENPVMPEKLEEFLVRVQTYTSEGLGILQNFVRYVDGARERDTEDVNLVELIEYVLDNQHEALETAINRIQIHKEFHCKLVARACRSELLEIFNNIIANAIDAMPDGGDLTITVNYRKHDKTGLISCTDTGAGMTDEEIEQAFLQLLSHKPHGLGLGLKLAKEYARRNSAKFVLRRGELNGLIAILEIPARKLEVQQ